MKALRSRLSTLACLTLAWQTGTLAAAPAVLGCAPGQRGAEQMACCEGEGPGHLCPMHQALADHAGSDRHALTPGCGAPDTAALTALLGPTAVVVAARSTPKPEASRAYAAAPGPSLPSRLPLPDLPPPRV